MAGDRVRWELPSGILLPLVGRDDYALDHSNRDARRSQRGGEPPTSVAPLARLAAEPHDLRIARVRRLCERMVAPESSIGCSKLPQRPSRAGASVVARPP